LRHILGNDAAGQALDADEQASVGMTVIAARVRIGDACLIDIVAGRLVSSHLLPCRIER
jgi:hypothetical protein